MDGQQKFALIGVAMCIVIALAILAGCAGDASIKTPQDWRTIHRPAPVTPGGGDGHGN